MRNIRLITNNPQKLVGLEGYGLKIVERVGVPLDVMLDSQNIKYLTTKVEKMEHLIDLGPNSVHTDPVQQSPEEETRQDA